MERVQKNVLLINPSHASVYTGKIKIREGVPHTPVLSLATIAAPLVNRGHNVRILDFNIVSGSSRHILLSELKRQSPDYVGITFTTPLYYEMAGLTRLIKEYDKDVKTVGGGHHISL